MRLYSVNANGASRLAVQGADGAFIDLQKAYECWLFESDGCASEEAAKSLAATLIPGDLVRLIEMGRMGAEACERAVRFAEEQGAGPWRLSGESVRLEAPLKTPRKFFCIGLNYRAHAEESNKPLPKAPLFFNKFATSIVGPNDPVVGPPVTEQLDYEVELAVVVGKRAKNVSEEEADQYVYGYTVVNDISARDLQKSDGQWVKGKALDTYAPLGPCVVTRDAIDASDLVLRTRVNGELRQESRTSDLIFTVPQLIAYLSRLITLEPGDIIATGTPSGVGGAMNPPRFLQPGDVVECEIEGIGLLRNTIVSASRGFS